MRSKAFRLLAGLAAISILLSPSFDNAAAGVAPSPAATQATTVKPNAVNNLDCNGWSPKYKPAKLGMALCTDPKGQTDEADETYRFNDNGHYIGHDEPSVRFISPTPGSASDNTYFMRLSTDPTQKPTVNTNTVSRYGELSVAPWFGMALCDPKSYPQSPCTPDSDSNGGAFFDPTAAGSAFMELQFYPPGFAPFNDGVSCDQIRWCASLNIDSFECNYDFSVCNNNCIEPANFAYLQTNGVPAGPPSPQLTNVSTFTPNRNTLMMYGGDNLRVTIHDTSQGLLTRVDDLTRGTSGFMVASGANGFTNTNISDCSGNPFNFHSEYSSALPQNQVPWSTLKSGILMQQEIGHFEKCASLSHPMPINDQEGPGQSFVDPSVYQTCNGGTEGPGGVGEGPCNAGTGICQNATTEDGLSCPTDDFTSNAPCEFSDAPCAPAGARVAKVNGLSTAYNWPIAGCLGQIFQNGDLDFDGTSYQPDWPDGSGGHPTPFSYIGPFTGSGNVPFPTVQFETNVGASEIFCDVGTGDGCTAVPAGAAFYPFWTLGKVAGTPINPPDQSQRHTCGWSFGNDVRGATVNDFGGAAQYGVPDVSFFGGTLSSDLLPNPQLSTTC
jgi:hypothetical protein